MAQGSIVDFLHQYKVRVFDNLEAPVLSVVVEGTSGTTTYEYKATYKTIVGESLPSSVVTLATGNATLTGFNKNKLSVLEIPSAVTKVRYWKNAWAYFSQNLRENSTHYDVGDYVVLASNSMVRYQCTSSGTTASADPGSWSSVLGSTKVDGTAVWTAVTNKNDIWVLLGEVDPDPGQLYDTGQATSVATLPTVNTSGRPGVIAILPKPGTMIQRAERVDTMSLFSKMVQDGFDLIHKSGDVIKGCNEYKIDGTLWGFMTGQVYFLGRFVDVPAGQVQLTGSGEEKVGITVTPTYVTPDDDYVWRCGEDEGVSGEYANTGPDILYLTITWVKDDPDMLVIKEFIDNEPKKVTLSPERTPLDIYVADKINDLAGPFVVEKFPMVVTEHPTDDSKMVLTVKRGKAYPNGFKTIVEGARTLNFERARDYQEVQNSSLPSFDSYGASNGWTVWEPSTEITLGTILLPTIERTNRYECTAIEDDNLTGAYEPTWPTVQNATVVDNNVTWKCLGNSFDVDGLSLTVKIGDGDTRTVTLVGDGKTNAQVVSAIEAVVNAESDLITGITGSSLVQVRTVEPKSLTLGGTALAVLGWSAGTTVFAGSRVYDIGEGFIRSVTDLSYQTEEVKVITRGNITTKDLVVNGLSSILGASTAELDCHDNIFDYNLNVDFIKDGNYIEWSGLSSNEPPDGTTYYVKYRRNHTATKGERWLCTVVDAEVVKGPLNSVDTLVFTNATSKTRNLNGDPVTLSGSPIDVVRVVRINDLDGLTTSKYSRFTLLNNSTGEGFSGAQISWDGAGEQGIGQPFTDASYYVTFELWHHAVEGDYVSADSYDVYDSIQSFGGFMLRDCIDFRTTSNVYPVTGYNTILDYTFYLSRIDKLMMDDGGNFFLIKGAPGLSPVIPNDQAGRMSLAILRLAPYTYSPDWVTVASIEPAVIQQKDMRSVLNRLDNLEYWKAVTDLEQEVTGSTHAEDAVNVYTNALTGFGKFDLSFHKQARVDDDTVDLIHTAALDLNNQCLLLPATPDMRTLAVDLNRSVGVRKVGNTLMLDYEPEMFLEQPYATDSVNLAMDYDYDTYRGTAVINPSTDSFVDTEQLPTINLDFDNNLQPLVQALTDSGALRLNEIIWSDWNTSYTNRAWNGYFWDPTGGWWVTPEQRDENFERLWSFGPNRSPFYFRGLPSVSGETTQRRWRDGVMRNLIPGSQQESLGTSVVGLAMVGKCRTQYPDGTPFRIQVEATNLMPNQDHAITVAGKPVNFTYGLVPNSTENITLRGSIGSHNYTVGSVNYTTVRTDNNGRLVGYFAMPTGVDAGNVPINIFHYSQPTLSNLAAYFSSAGYSTKTRETTIGMPTYNYTSTPYHEELVRTVYNNYYDPLAQTFVVYDRTRFMSEVDVYFRTKHVTANPDDALGVRMEIRDTINGQPGNTILATARMEAADITVSEDATAATRFQLDSVIGYNQNSEFSIVMFPDLNNTHYEVWTAKVGNIDVSTGALITSQTNDGVLFHSPNNRVWEPMTKQDLKFKLYGCNFRSSCNFIFERITGIQAGVFVAAIDQFAAAGTDVKWYYSADSKSIDDAAKAWLPFYPNIDTYVSTLLTLIDLKCDVESLGGSYQLINPVSGIVFMLHKADSWAIFPNSVQNDDLFYPNTIKCYLKESVPDDTVLKPYFSWDDGLTLVEIAKDVDFVSSWIRGSYYTNLYTTPVSKSVETASAATPIVITSTAHSYKENAIVTITGVTGNNAANGTFTIRNVTPNTFDLYDPTTKAPIVGLGSGTGGTMEYGELQQCRTFLRFMTNNQVRTPRVQDISFILSKV